MPDEAALALLAKGTLTLEGRLLAASNATLLGTVSADGGVAACVYKPVAGERPLWDFPDGTLAARERAAYLVSEASGWAMVPPTVLRDGPMGPGMCQLWVDPDPTRTVVDVVPSADVGEGWLEVLQAFDADGEPVSLVHADEPALRHIALLDAVINNADRKGGHVLAPEDGSIRGIDHGICFSADDKLRTVLWGWSRTPITDEEHAVLSSLLAALESSLGKDLAELLTAEEVQRTRERLDALMTSRVFPSPSSAWPAIPWPPF